MKKSAKKKINNSQSVLFFVVKSIIPMTILVLILVFLFSEGDKTPQGDEKNPAVVCSSEYYPVCGKDGKTYPNSCTAEKIADIRVAYVGQCREENSNTEAVTPEKNESGTGSAGEDIESTPIVPPVENPGELPNEDRETLSGSSERTQVSGEISINPTWISYFNETYQYGFSMPKNSYYQAFGAQNGASHSVGIMTGTGVESFAQSTVRVYFYANKIVEDLYRAENGFYMDPLSQTVYLLLGDKHSVAIESDDAESELVQTIIRTVHKK